MAFFGNVKGLLGGMKACKTIAESSRETSFSTGDMDPCGTRYGKYDVAQGEVWFWGFEHVETCLAYIQFAPQGSQL